MSVLNRKRVKLIVKEYGKQASQEFLDRLDCIVRDYIYHAIKQLPSSMKRLKASELI